MRLVDANILLYAVNRDSRHHSASLAWLDDALSGKSTVAFAWIALLGFVRLASKEGLFPRPLSVEEAFDRVDAWLGSGPAVVVEPTREHSRIMRRLLGSVGSGGNLVNDAHLAALAVEHGCTIVSYDHDFDRFEGIARESPADLV